MSFCLLCMCFHRTVMCLENLFFVMHFVRSSCKVWLVLYSAFVFLSQNIRPADASLHETPAVSSRSKATPNSGPVASSLRKSRRRGVPQDYNWKWFLFLKSQEISSVQNVLSGYPSENGAHLMTFVKGCKTQELKLMWHWQTLDLSEAICRNLCNMCIPQCVLTFPRTAQCVTHSAQHYVIVHRVFHVFWRTQQDFIPTVYIWFWMYVFRR